MEGKEKIDLNGIRNTLSLKDFYVENSNLIFFELNVVFYGPIKTIESSFPAPEKGTTRDCPLFNPGKLL